VCGDKLFVHVVSRHRASRRDSADAVDSPPGSGALPQTAGAGGGRVYASPSHHICPSNQHIHCADKYDTAGAPGAYWFETSLRPSVASQLCWNQTVKFLSPSDDELLTTSSAHDPYSVDRNWTAVTGTDPVTAVNL